MTVTKFEYLATVLKNMTTKYYYAVAKGRKPGIYHTW